MKYHFNREGLVVEGCISKESGKNRWAKKSLDIVANAFCVPKEQITGVRRHRVFVLPRFIWWYFLRDVCLMTYQQIADFSGRDHSTIISGVQRASYMIERYPEFSKKYAIIKENWENIA